MSAVKPKRLIDPKPVVLLFCSDKPGPADSNQDTKKVTEGLDITLQCTFTDKGLPEATFTWTRDGETVQSDDSTGEYTITSANIVEDDGEYKCTPVNDVGAGESKTVNVLVQSEYNFKLLHWMY